MKLIINNLLTMQIFDFSDYKDFLNYLFGANTEHGFKKLVAAKLDVPSSFLSQVLHKEIQFSQDHAYKLAKFLNFNDMETEYLINLVALARATSFEYRNHLLSKIEKLKVESKDLSKRLSNKTEIENLKHQLLYYSKIEYSIVHLLLGIPQYQTVEKLSERTDLNRENLNKILHDLEEMHLIEKKGISKWLRKSNSIHLPKTSPLSYVNHCLWRDLVKNKINNQTGEELFYSAQHTLSKKDFEKIKSNFLATLEHNRKIVQDSSDEELIGINLDIFKI